MSLTTDPNDPRLEKYRMQYNANAGGQQEVYLVLTEEERSRGYQRPYRTAYRHEKCGTVTHMAHAIAETYAVNPSFYGATYCAGCMRHLPVGPEGEFIWVNADGTDTEDKVGA